MACPIATEINARQISLKAYKTIYWIENIMVRGRWKHLYHFYKTRHDVKI